MDVEKEMFFMCPCCGEQISMVLEGLYGTQSYIEDCEVCCNPIQITYEVQEDEIIMVEAKPAQ